MLLLTLRGTPTIYYGDELGLPDADVPPGRVVDVAGRDPERSPMPWARRGPNAGFSDGEPWLPMVDDAATLSVEAQRADPASILSLHRRLLAVRRASPALHAGSLELVDAPAGVVAFDRRHGGEAVRVVLNLTGDPVAVPIDGAWTCLAGTRPGREGTRVEGGVPLAADEGLVLRRG